MPLSEVRASGLGTGLDLDRFRHSVLISPLAYMLLTLVHIRVKMDCLQDAVHRNICELPCWKCTVYGQAFFVCSWPTCKWLFDFSLGSASLCCKNV